MSGAPALVLSLVLLGLTLGAAVIRPPRVPEAAVASAGAVLVVLTGSLSLSQAAATVRELAPTVGFLAALLLIAEGCRREGLFAAIGDLIARRCAGRHGLSTAVADLLPNGATLPDLLLIAILSAVLANLVNNIPATLILLPVAVSLGTGPVLAMLVGVNVGPNLTPAGSLATLLWRRILRTAGVELAIREFLELGVLTVPAGLVLATIGVWLSLQVGI